jgi:hypothetical protein
MKIAIRAPWICTLICCLLSGCHDSPEDAKGEAEAKAGNKGPADEVTLSIKAQAEQKIEVAPVELGTAVVSQRAKPCIGMLLPMRTRSAM